MIAAFDVIILGAAGLMCAMTAGSRGRQLELLEHANAAGKKILISAGWRCNFTNPEASPERFVSANSDVCHAALARYTQHNFVVLVEKRRIPWNEKTLGQLFCDGAWTPR